MIETKTVFRVRCPAELMLPLPGRVLVPDDDTVAIEGAPAALEWIAARFRREDDLERRLIDAAGECPDG